MNPDDVTFDSRLARRLRLETHGGRMMLSVPRFGLSMLLGVLASAFLVGYWVLAPDALAAKPAVQQYEDLPGGRIALSPLVEFESPESASKKKIMSHLREWEPVLVLPLGFLVFFISYGTLRQRIVLDRNNNALRRGTRSVCALSEVVGVELDDAPRIYVMNTLALVLVGDRRLVLLYYDAATDSGLLRKTGAIAAFLGVPLQATRGTGARRSGK